MVNWLLEVRLGVPERRCTRMSGRPAGGEHGVRTGTNRSSGGSSARDRSVSRRSAGAQVSVLLGIGESRNGLVPDRWPSPSFSSIAAVGFG